MNITVEFGRSADEDRLKTAVAFIKRQYNYQHFGDIHSADFSGEKPGPLLMILKLTEGFNSRNIIVDGRVISPAELKTMLNTRK